MIRFLWIKEFGCLKNASFNFYGPLRYSYDAETADLTEDQRLTSVENTQFIPRFFSGDDPESPEIACTLIVGENRSGKTTLLKFLSRLVAEDLDECGDFFVVWEVANNIKKFRFRKGEEKTEDLEKEFIANFKPHFSAGLYHSNIFNSYATGSDGGFGGFPGDYNGFLNISTDALLFAASNTRTSKTSNLTSFNSSQARYYDTDITKQARFFIAGNGANSVCSHFNISIPAAITVSYGASYLDPSKKRKEKQAGWEQMFWEFLGSIASRWNLIDAELQNSKHIFIFQTIAHFIYQTLNSSSQPMKTFLCEAAKRKLFEPHPEKFSAHRDILADIDRISEMFFDVDREAQRLSRGELGKESIEDEDFNVFGKSVSALHAAVLEITNLFESNAIRKSTTNQWEIPIKSFQNVLSGIINLSDLSHWMRFEWRNMSSGEKNILSLFSRLEHGIFQSLSNHSSEILLIFLDEPEVGLHPQWQQRLFQGLLGYLHTLHQRGISQKIQLIFTSNQPIMISDIPKRSICYLEYEAQTQTSRALSDEKTNEKNMKSYCANIGGILSSSFFLRDGYVGKFAQLKVNAVITKADAREKIDAREIELIDSPIVKAYIENLLS